MDLLQLCKDLISIPSVTVPNGTKEIISFITPHFRNLGFRIKTQEFAIDDHPNDNFLASIGPEKSEQALLINTHLDTVSPGPNYKKTWTKCNGNPFQAAEDEGFLHGLGAADTKLAMACVLVAITRLLERKDPSSFKQTLHVMGTAGEEKGLLGAKHAMETNFVQARYAVDSEPSNLQIVWSHKGFCVYQITLRPRGWQKEIEIEDPVIAISFQGEAAHSSTPHLGRNALTQALSFLDLFFQKTDKWGPHSLKPFLLEGGSLTNVIPAHATLYMHGLMSPGKFVESLETQDLNIQVEEISFPNQKRPLALPEDLLRIAVVFYRKIEQIAEEMKGPVRPDFSPPMATSALTLACPEKAGDVPYLTFFLDHRFMDPESGTRFFVLLSEAAKHLSETFENVEIQVELERQDLPLLGDKNAPFVLDVQGILQDMGLAGDLVTKSGCTEGTLFSNHGMQTIVIGPGRAENNIHRPNEKIEIQELHQAVQFYERLIEKICL